MVDYITELRIDGQWTAITSDVRDSKPITMSHGRQDWASTTDPSTCALKLNNGASKIIPGQFGRYSPRNPRSDLYGKIGRNTPIRVRRSTRRPRLYLPGVEDAAAWTPNATPLRLTGDQRIEFLVRPRTWRPGGTDSGGGFGLGRRYSIVTAARAWAAWVAPSGRIRYRWSTDGTATLTRESAAAVPADAGEVWVAVWLDVVDGANHTVGFATSPDGITWTALGANQTAAGNTNMFPAHTELDVGRVLGPGGGIGVTSFHGEVGAFRYRSGILPTSPIVASVDFRTLDTDDTTVLDNASRTWHVASPGYITDSSIRFTGEAASWPAAWDLSGADQWVNLTAAGITRRLQQGKKPLKSSLFRDLSVRSNVAYYIPMEEPDGAGRFTSGRAGDTSYLQPSDPAAVDFAASEDFVASAPLPTVGAATIDGRVPTYAPNASQRFVFLAAVPATGMSTDRHLARFSTTGTMGRWELIYAAGGGARMRAYDNEGVLFFDHGPLGADLHGTLQMHSLWLEQQGSTLFYQWARFPLGAGIAFIVDEGAIPSKTYGRFDNVQLGTPVGVENTVFGHLALFNGDVHSIWDVAGSSLVAWSGEGGTRRLQRLAADERLPPIRQIGGADVEPMGPQRLLTLMSLMREVPAADLGILTDAPDAVALQYRARTDLYNQTPALVLDYPTGVIADPVPVDDDRYTRNAVEVTRVRGSSFTAVQETGPMSVQDPPAGVGKYDVSQELNIATDGRLTDQAFWRLHLGTIDEARWPTLRIDLRNERAALLLDEVLSVRVGDIIRIANPPAWLPGGPYDLLVEGWTEEKTSETHYIEFTCSPGSAWTVGVVAGDTETPGPDEPKRADTAGTARFGTPISETQTSITFRTTVGPLWTTDPADLPLDIMVGGERMRVTAIGPDTGSGNQLFTVVRGVNGVVKSHPAGTTASLFTPARCAL